MNLVVIICAVSFFAFIGLFVFGVYLAAAGCKIFRNVKKLYPDVFLWGRPIDILFKNDKEIHIGCIGNNKDIRRAIVNLFVLQHKWILVMQLECAILIILCTSLIILRVCKYPGIKNVIFLIPIIICCAVVMIICRNLRRRTARVISQIVGDKSWVDDPVDQRRNSIV